MKEEGVREKMKEEEEVVVEGGQTIGRKKCRGKKAREKIMTVRVYMCVCVFIYVCVCVRYQLKVSFFRCLSHPTLFFRTFRHHEGLSEDLNGWRGT